MYMYIENLIMFSAMTTSKWDLLEQENEEEDKPQEEADEDIDGQ